MTKISNIIAYQKDITISDNDYLIGTNGDTDKKETKTYPVSEIKAYILEGLVIPTPEPELKTLFGTFKFIRKGFGNTDVINNEIGDIFEGGISEGIYCPFAIWLGGSLNDANNFNIVTTHEY